MKFLTWFRSITHYLFLFGIALIIIGLLYSKLFISIGSFTILGTWIIDWEMKSKFASFFKNKVAIAISLLFILHIIGLVYTENMEYALKDIRIKLPLLLFPLVFSTSKRLNPKEFLFFKLLLITAVLSSTFISAYFLFFGGDFYSSNSRNISLFISHIRLALLVCIAIFFCYDIYQNRHQNGFAIPVLIIGIWFILFLLFSQFITGLVVLIISTSIIVFLKVFKSKKKNQIITLSLTTIAICFGLGIYVNSLYKEFLKTQDVKDLPFLEKSAAGEVYLHPDLNNPHPHRQNGYMVYKNIAWEEFEKSWNERSKIDYNGNTIHGYPIKDVALWYLTSKGQKKDAEAINSLSDEEIKAIENGTANYNYLHKPGLEVRIIETFWEIRNYLDGGDFNGHSIAMRLEFWKTAYHIFKDNWLIGTGTGDINDAFKKQYKLDNTILHENWQLRTHNQYITLATTFGILGLIIALYSFLAPFYYVKDNWLYIAFGIIILTSMLNEDTLETQVGATLFAFFNSFLFFLKSENNSSFNSK